MDVDKPSRRFNCEWCGQKCRSSKSQRGLRSLCRPCEKKKSFIEGLGDNELKLIKELIKERETL